MHILVCGGAGYIGSHMVKFLADRGHAVDVLDHLGTGHREAVQMGRLIEADILKPELLDPIFSAVKYDAVMHFCALSLVGASVQQPYAYYQNNITGTLNLLEAMRMHGVDKLVFSSTAAVFGNPQAELIDENHPCNPINPYGRSKRMVELMLEDAARAYGLRSVALRYFNAAGADPSGHIGESHVPETHLIPSLFRSILGDGPQLKVFGIDYPTLDGTCVRDYIHVNDLADAHLRAISYMQEREGAHRFNLGNGQGFSVKQVIDTAAKILGRSVEYETGPRRAGDPAILVASSGKARKELGWQPKFTAIDEILETAWRWHQAPRY